MLHQTTAFRLQHLLQYQILFVTTHCLIVWVHCTAYSYRTMILSVIYTNRIMHQHCWSDLYSHSRLSEVTRDLTQYIWFSPAWSVTMTNFPVRLKMLSAFINRENVWSHEAQPLVLRRHSWSKNVPLPQFSCHAKLGHSRSTCMRIHKGSPKLSFLRSPISRVEGVVDHPCRNFPITYFGHHAKFGCSICYSLWAYVEGAKNLVTLGLHLLGL